jgi:malto-oligosyltrehalose trehalohydrolase
MRAFRFGPHREDDGRVRFHLWAPGADAVTLEIEGRPTIAMTATGHGWREAAAEVEAGARYCFQIGEQRVPDPASRRQAGDVHDASILCDPNSYAWRATGWKGRPWEETVLYELHPGLFGGFNGIAAELPRLARLGVTAIELMPIAEFPGARSWGYDGVLPFAPDCAYGTPDELKALIDRAHELGLMMFLDVVYNHFGPDGNWLPLYAPQFFDETVQTPWGGAIALRVPEVRRFFTENALYWLNEFRFDGLRFDAVHALTDRDWLFELAAELRAGAGPDRRIHLVLENDGNDAQLLNGSYDAQWNDDIHHVLHHLLTGETAGYYADYAVAPAEKLARALAEGFVYQGEASAYRNGAPRGAPSAELSPTAFVAFLQNHDQTGNRAFGERLTTLADPRALRAAVALVLLAPQIPLIFMGEEAGARDPFLYFTDHHAELADAVREGRRAEFAKFPAFAAAAARERIPDPNACETYERSRPSLDGPASETWRSLYADLLQLRHRMIVPHLKGARAEEAHAIGPKAVLAHWRLANGSRLTIGCNLGDRDAPARLPAATPVWGTASGNVVPAFTTLAWIAP